MPRHVIAVTTPDKIGTSVTFTACPTGRIHTLVTRDLPSEAESWLAVSDVEVLDQA